MFDSIGYIHCTQQASNLVGEFNPEVLELIKKSGIYEEKNKTIEERLLDCRQHATGWVSFFPLGVALCDGNLKKYLELYLKNIKSQLKTDEQILKEYKETINMHPYLKERYKKEFGREDLESKFTILLFAEQAYLRQHMLMINRFLNLLNKVKDNEEAKQKLINDFFRIFPPIVSQSKKDFVEFTVSKKDYVNFFDKEYLEKITGIEDIKIEQNLLKKDIYDPVKELFVNELRSIINSGFNANKFRYYYKYQTEDGTIKTNHRDLNEDEKVILKGIYYQVVTIYDEMIKEPKIQKLEELEKIEEQGDKKKYCDTLKDIINRLLINNGLINGRFDLSRIGYANSKEYRPFVGSFLESFFKNKAIIKANEKQDMYIEEEKVDERSSKKAKVGLNNVFKEDMMM